MVKVSVVLLLALVSLCMGVDRETRCGTDSDCVTVKDATGGGQLLVDGLDLSDKTNGHTVATVEERLPSWFGPKRPVYFTYEDEVLSPTVPMAMYDVKLADTILMMSKPIEKEL